MSAGVPALTTKATSGWRIAYDVGDTAEPLEAEEEGLARVQGGRPEIPAPRRRVPPPGRARAERAEGQTVAGPAAVRAEAEPAAGATGGR